MNVYNKYNKLTKGRARQAEQEFINRCIEHDIEYRKATVNEDKYKHHDVYVKGKSGNEIGIDVKDHKRRNGEPDQKYCVLEISNAWGYSWCNGTGYIAFKYNNKFLLVNRTNLQQYISDKIDTNQPKLLMKYKYSMNEEDIAYKLFYRAEAPKEAIVLVPWTDILNITSKEI